MEKYVISVGDPLDNETIFRALAEGTVNGSKVQYIMNYQGEQSGVTVLVFAIKDGKAYTLTFITDPLMAPHTIPIGEKILQSFRFV
jgi:hypothetical protein